MAKSGGLLKKEESKKREEKLKLEDWRGSLKGKGARVLAIQT